MFNKKTGKRHFLIFLGIGCKKEKNTTLIQESFRFELPLKKMT